MSINLKNPQRIQIKNVMIKSKKNASLKVSTFIYYKFCKCFLSRTKKFEINKKVKEYEEEKSFIDKIFDAYAYLRMFNEFENLKKFMLNDQQRNFLSFVNSKSEMMQAKTKNIDKYSKLFSICTSKCTLSNNYFDKKINEFLDNNIFNRVEKNNL